MSSITVKPKKEKNIQEILSSEQYLSECAEIAGKVQSDQTLLDENFRKAKKEYDEVLLPAWKKEKKQWEQEQQRSIDEAQSTLEKAKSELSKLYESLSTIPLRCRNREALKFIFDAMSTYGYDIESAVRLYSKKQYPSML